MRVWPYRVISVTVKIEITAPAARMVPAHVPWVTLSRMVASPASCWWAKFCQGWAAERGERDEDVHAGDDHQRGDHRARHGLLRVF